MCRHDLAVERVGIRSKKRMSDDPLPTVPFFVVGNPRSGTTLLRSILCGHSQIDIPDETGFLAHLGRYQSRRLSREEIEQLVGDLGRMNHEWSGLVDDVDTFCESLPESTLRHALDALYRIKTNDAARWGDKGPSYVRVLPTINKIFPDAKFIHIIRDGRDSVLSALKKWSDRYWYYDTYYLLQTWKQNVTLGRQAASWLGPERYLEIRYEELVENTEATVRKICDFLDEPFEATMLENTAAGKRIAGPTGHHEVAAPVSVGSVANWKTKMTVFDQKLSEQMVGPLLRDLGYDVPEMPAMTIGERIKKTQMAVRYLSLDLAKRLLFASGWLKMSREKSSPESQVPVST